MKEKLIIEGMSCNHCVMHVKNALVEVPGVKSVEVSLEDKCAIVEGENLSKENLKKAVEEMGYDVVDI
ncbi:copper-exporting P-type ATPase A [Clostridium acetireducens DSM 10703]|uniref:Copper-exporting P-type ATPase A n=1 Tax=Clostridium acetireducens DSM 10703 TaxID=1121290 RepID=A0A1E8EZJ0_9CLOT|nr:cation transporter [Clostridium acetireducens]OFI06541.1 copper-exporting P-type ATPase A [Clostridium acetireducens DSM 10703]